NPSKVCYILSSDTPFAGLLREEFSLQPESTLSEPILDLYSCPTESILDAVLGAAAASPVYGESADLQEPEDLAVHMPVRFDGLLDFLGYRWPELMPSDAQSMTLATYWQVQARPDGQLRIFVHLTNAQEYILAQYDGLDIPPEGWHPGDVLVQLHTLRLPADWTAASDYRIEIGLYDPETLGRVQAFDSTGASLGNYILLGDQLSE
ncbi:MAG: hypothetical protein MUQ30_07875, partial [Anaerolineae bacterium]|nr:hypothetical protein [Anaerolineae bacterium]